MKTRYFFANASKDDDSLVILDTLVHVEHSLYANECCRVANILNQKHNFLKVTVAIDEEFHMVIMAIMIEILHATTEDIQLYVEKVLEVEDEIVELIKRI